jgi:hypothetical protein
MSKWIFVTRGLEMTGRGRLSLKWEEPLFNISPGMGDDVEAGLMAADERRRGEFGK